MIFSTKFFLSFQISNNKLCIIFRFGCSLFIIFAYSYSMYCYMLFYDLAPSVNVDVFLSLLSFSRPSVPNQCQSYMTSCSQLFMLHQAKMDYDASAKQGGHSPQPAPPSPMQSLLPRVSYTSMAECCPGERRTRY